MKTDFKPIGIIHSPFKKPEDIRQERYRGPHGFDPIEGRLEIFPDYALGLQDTDGFTHLIVIFLFHKSREAHLLARPPFQKQERGVFATRSPYRPNPVGMTVIRLLRRRDNILYAAGLDMIDGTPILDIKPYTPRDHKSDARYGWIEGTDLGRSS